MYVNICMGYPFSKNYLNLHCAQPLKITDLGKKLVCVVLHVCSKYDHQCCVTSKQGL